MKRRRRRNSYTQPPFVTATYLFAKPYTCVSSWLFDTLHTKPNPRPRGSGNPELWDVATARFRCIFGIFMHVFLGMENVEHDRRGDVKLQRAAFGRTRRRRCTGVPQGLVKNGPEPLGKPCYGAEATACARYHRWIEDALNLLDRKSVV